MLARVERVEIGKAIGAKYHSLAIDHEMLLPVLEGRLDDPRIAACPVIAVACDQAHAVAVALQPKAIAVVLDLVKPVRPGGNVGSTSRNAKIKSLKHATKIVTA